MVVKKVEKDKAILDILVGRSTVVAIWAIQFSNVTYLLPSARPGDMNLRGCHKEAGL